MPYPFEHTYAALSDRLFAPAEPTQVAQPTLLALNEPLARFLGLDPAELASDEGVMALAGQRVPVGARPIALAYAGHQFGQFVPQLGDGRAILLGELVAGDGRRYDVQLKGSGPTPFSRRGDGRAALGPVLREYVVSEAMHALGVPTTRSLAAVATGEPVFRERPLPGAVLARVAASHLRIGTFQYFAARDDRASLEALVGYALARHYPDADLSEGRSLALLDAVVAAQARLVAQWLALGFVHGVMNTDNMSVAGETLDYGPCAFLDAFDPTRTFSSIDRTGRYAYANQPRIALWNLARLADALMPLVDDDEARAVALLEARLDRFAMHFQLAYGRALARKLGAVHPGDEVFALAQELLAHMAEERVDFTRAFRTLCGVLDTEGTPFVALFHDRARLDAWLARFRAIHAAEPASAVRARMEQQNPAYIPRNHRIEEMIASAEAGDLEPMRRLSRVLARPFDEQPDALDLLEPPGDEQWRYRTFCGT